MTAARSPAERRLAEARERLVQCACAWLYREAFLIEVDELVAAAREAERDRMLAGQYDADVDPGAGR